jgi:hypothetical protein
VVRATFIGSLQNIEKQEHLSDIERTEASGGSKSKTLTERDGVPTERIERTANDLHMAHKRDTTGFGCDK